MRSAYIQRFRIETGRSYPGHDSKYQRQEGFVAGGHWVAEDREQNSEVGMRNAEVGGSAAANEDRKNQRVLDQIIVGAAFSRDQQFEIDPDRG